MKKFYQFALLSIICLQGIGQQKGVYDYADLLAAQIMYKNFNNLSCDVIINYSDSANQGTIIESAAGMYAIRDRYFYQQVDSNIVVSGNSYNIVCNATDKSILVMPKSDRLNVFGIPLEDSLFVQYQITGAQTVAVGDSLKTTHLLFAPESRYSKYSVTFNKKTRLIKEIKLYTRNMENEITGSIYTGLMHIQFSNYDFGELPFSYFDEFKYIKRNGNTIIPTPAYEGYIVQTSGVN
jgi:hypothetical protein